MTSQVNQEGQLIVKQTKVGRVAEEHRRKYCRQWSSIYKSSLIMKKASNITQKVKEISRQRATEESVFLKSLISFWDKEDPLKDFKLEECEITEELDSSGEYVLGNSRQRSPMTLVQLFR